MHAQPRGSVFHANFERASFDENRVDSGSKPPPRWPRQCCRRLCRASGCLRLPVDCMIPGVQGDSEPHTVFTAAARAPTVRVVLPFSRAMAGFLLVRFDKTGALFPRDVPERRCEDRSGFFLRCKRAFLWRGRSCARTKEEVIEPARINIPVLKIGIVEDAAEKRDIRFDSARVIFAQALAAVAQSLRRGRCPRRSVFRAWDRIRWAQSSRYRSRRPGGFPDRPASAG